VPETCVSNKVLPPSHIEPGGDMTKPPAIVTIFVSSNPLA